MLILVTCCWGQRAPQGAKEAGVEALHVTQLVRHSGQNLSSSSTNSHFRDVRIARS